MTIDCTMRRSQPEACYKLYLSAGTCSVCDGQFVPFADVSFYHKMKYALHSFQLLVTCTHVELLLINKRCVDPQSCVFGQIRAPYSYTPWAWAAPSRIPIQCCKIYGGMLKIGLQPSWITDSPLKTIGYISGSRVSHRASLLLLLWAWFLSPFLFSTLMSLNSNNQQSGWIVYLVEYSPGYRQSLMWSMAWHHMCGIW
jgi:hypothetical protein